MSRRRLALLGATGSIGASTRAVLRKHPERFEVAALTARRNVEGMLSWIEEFRPAYVAMADPEAAASLRERVDGVEVGEGVEGLVTAATLDGLDLLVAAVVGAAGLPPVYAALDRGTDVALANKEVLVAGGELVTEKVARSGARLLPVDSEHSALFQALGESPPESVRKLWLTASGGPFRGRTRAELEGVTREQALKHPTWDMGAKITIDSATLMNKGLEVIEARWLFGVDYDRIDVVVHPQSILHSMVEYVDGSWIAQMGVTDMKVPIQVALSWPERWEAPDLPDLDVTALRDLTFEPPDPETFRNLALAYEAGRRGGSYPCALSAANEVAVEAFLEERIPFLAIPEVNERVLAQHEPAASQEYEAVLDADARARAAAAAAVEELAG